MSSNRKTFTPVVLTILIAIFFKIYLLFIDVVPFNSDEAIVGLMARHIIEGARPLFFYGQSYMGSLDAFLIAGMYKIIGDSVAAIRAVQLILYGLFILTTFMIGRYVFFSKKTGLFSVLLLAIPVVNVTLYTTVSLGGYGEALLLSNLLFLTGYYLISQINRSNNEDQQGNNRSILFLAGFFCFLSGFGIWVNGITLVYSIPMGLIFIISLIKSRKSVPLKMWISLGSVVVLSVLVGLSPWIYFAASNGFGSLIVELFGYAVNVEMGSWLQRSWQHIINYFLLGGTVTLGLRPPWEVRWLAPPLIPVVLLIWIIVIGFWVRRLFCKSNNKTIQDQMLMGIFLFQFIGFIFTPFGVDPSGRYFLPLTMPLMIIAGEMVQEISKWRYWQYALTMGLVIFQSTGNIQCAYRYPPGITTQFYSVTMIDHRYDDQLIQFLKEKDEYYGYSNYWVSYPLAFKSNEELIYVPMLPYHQDLRYTSRDNRIEHYNDVVAKSSKAAYITTNNPQLDENIVRGLGRMNITWSEHTIGDYRIFYDLSQLVYPEDLQLGF